MVDGFRDFLLNIFVGYWSRTLLKEVTIQKWQTVFLLFEIFDIGTNRLRVTPRVSQYYVLIPQANFFVT